MGKRINSYENVSSGANDGILDTYMWDAPYDGTNYYYVAPTSSGGDIWCGPNPLDENVTCIPDTNRRLTIPMPADFFTGADGNYHPTLANEDIPGVEGSGIIAASRYDVDNVIIDHDVTIELDVPSGTRTTVITVANEFTLGTRASLNCGHDGKTPGDPNDVVIFMRNTLQLSIGDYTCVSALIYLDGIDGKQDASHTDIYGALSADEFGTFNDVNITYVKPTRSIPDICNGTDYNWTLVGIPAETGPTNTVTVEDVFGDNLGVANYNTTPGQRGWTLFKRDFNTSANNSWYEEMDLNDTVTVTGHGSTLDRGEGYWLRSDPTNHWDAEKPPLTGVTWNITNPGPEGCSVTNNCADYPLTLPDSTCESDPSGPFRNIMIGYLGDTNASWADYGFYVDSTTPYSPAGMQTAEYATDQIWQYDETNDDYDTCSSAMACDTPPYKGFWVQLRCGAREGVLTSVDLIIPNGK